jgi:hypothetical protein
MNPLSFFLFIFLLVAFNTFGQREKDVLDKYFKAIGGREGWAKVVSSADFYDTESRAIEMPTGGISLITPVIAEAGIHLYKKKSSTEAWDRFITVPSFSTDSFTTCYNGSKYWTQKKNSKPEVYSDFVNVYKKYISCGEPCLLLKVDSLKYLKYEYGIEIMEMFVNGDSYLYYFDSNTGFLVKSHRSGVNTITHYKNYTNVKGLYIPFTEEITKDGNIITKVQRRIFLINIELNDMLFKFPDSPYPILSVPLSNER